MRLKLFQQNMPPRPSAYRSFVTCGDPEGIIDCGTVRKSRLAKMENSTERQKMPKSLNMMSCASKEEMRLKDGVGNSRNSASQLEEIEKGAKKLNGMIESWASGMSIDGQSKDIARDLLRGALDLQESLNMLSKVQEASLYIAKLKRLERRKGETVQNGRFSVDGSSRSSDIKELKKVTHDSSVRQNLLPITCVESHWDKRRISGASEVQSTSSSQSSVYFSKKACSNDNSSVSSDTSDKNQKRPNLIAKLMGLEDKKLVQAIASTSNELQKEKKVPPRSAFDIDLPKARKPHLETPNTYQEKRTLRELLEATQSIGHLGSNFVERLIPVFDLLPRTPRTNQSRIDADKFPPIVIMKPMHAPYKDMENSQDLRFKSNERGLDASEIVKELKAKNHFSHVQDQVPGRVALIQNEKSSTSRVLTQENSKLPKVAVVKLKSTKTKIKEKAVVSMERTRANKNVKTVKSPEVSNSTSKYGKEKNASVTKLLVPKDAQDSPVMASNNPNKNQSVMKTRTSSVQKVSQPIVSKITNEAAKHYPTGVKKTRRKKEKLVTQPLKTDTLKHEDEAAVVDRSCQLSVETHAVPLPVKTKIITDAEIEDKWKDVEVLHYTSHTERCYVYSNDVSCETVISNTSWLNSRSFQQNLLLSSPSFAALVEVLFNLDVSASEVVTPSINTEADTTLFICYAKEVIERKSQLLPYGATSMSIPISLHQLIEEVCDGYEAIDSYKDGTRTVDIFNMLDRDMKCKEVVSSIWDLGWNNGYSAKETEQIVADLEKHFLSDLIDEIFVQ
ncbi:unnamed protein product [Rhodiola kirilowii]